MNAIGVRGWGLNHQPDHVMSQDTGIARTRGSRFGTSTPGQAIRRASEAVVGR